MRLELIAHASRVRIRFAHTEQNGELELRNGSVPDLLYLVCRTFQDDLKNGFLCVQAIEIISSHESDYVPFASCTSQHFADVRACSSYLLSSLWKTRDKRVDLMKPELLAGNRLDYCMETLHKRVRHHTGYVGSTRIDAALPTISPVHVFRSNKHVSQRQMHLYQFYHGKSQLLTMSPTDASNFANQLIQTYRENISGCVRSLFMS